MTAAPTLRPAEPGLSSRRARLLELLRRHGRDPTSFQLLDGAYRLWFAEGAAVGYVDTGRALVVAGSPVCPEERLARVTARFVAAAARRGRGVAFFGVDDRFLALTGLRSLPVGQLCSWEPRGWPELLARVPSLREQLRRARAKGVTIELAGRRLAWLRSGLLELRSRWAARHGMATMSFLAQPASLELGPQGDRAFLVALRDARPIGYLCLSPIYARRGALVQEWVRDPAAPNGTTELLVDAAFRWAAAQGLEYATLGLSPLAGPVSPWLRAARALGQPWYDFEGLAAFKAKLRPHAVESVALAGAGLPKAALLAESLRAFAGGSVIRFGAATLRRRLSRAAARPLPAQEELPIG